MTNRRSSSPFDGMTFAGLVITGGASWYLWTTCHAEIAYYTLKWSWELLTFLGQILPSKWFAQLRLMLADLATHAQDLSLDQLLAGLNQVGYVFIPFPILLSVWAIKIAHQHPANRTNRVIDVHTLPWIMSRHSPGVIPTLYYGDLMNEDPVEHRSSQNPEEFVAQHGLLINGKLDRARCRQLLIADLDKPIQSLDQLQPHERVFFVLCGTRLFLQRRDAVQTQSLLDQLNFSCHKHTWNGKRGYPNLAITDPLFAQYRTLPEAQAWLAKHPYPRTLLHAMHKAACAFGKLPSSQFLWLKGMDRKLWYALNTTGRKAPFLESAAVFTQTLWETFAADIGYQLTEPYIDDAIKGIEVYLVKIGLMNEDKQP